MKKLMICFSFLLFSFPNDSSANVVDPHETYTYEKMKADIWELKKKYKEELQVKAIGYSHFGRKIFAIKLGKGEKNILFIGSHHGREWITSSLLMEMLETYTMSYNGKEKVGPYSSNILDDVSIWFVPMLNPDGVTVQQGGIAEFPRHHRNNLMEMNLGSTDFSRWKANGIGVDLNRQYPVGWKKISGEEAMKPSYQFYKGKKPISTFETKSIVKFTKKIKPIIAVSYHTAGKEIYWDYHNGENKQRDFQIASKVATLTGYELAIPPEESVGAGYTDWFISHFQKPAMTIEIGDLVGETNPPISVFEEEWKSNQFIGMMLAELAKNKDVNKEEGRND